MTIQWTKDLAIGLNEIDGQHKELFSRINYLLVAMKQGESTDEVRETIRFLGDYVLTHFRSEERYMTMYGYPDYSTHKAEHSEFTRNFYGLKRRVQANGTGVHIAVVTTHMVVDWWNNHIRNMDRALGSFLNTKIQLYGEKSYGKESSISCL